MGWRGEAEPAPLFLSPLARPPEGRGGGPGSHTAVQSSGMFHSPSALNGGPPRGGGLSRPCFPDGSVGLSPLASNHTQIRSRRHADTRTHSHTHTQTRTQTRHALRPGPTWPRPFSAAPWGVKGRAQTGRAAAGWQEPGPGTPGHSQTLPTEGLVSPCPSPGPSPWTGTFPRLAPLPACCPRLCRLALGVSPKHRFLWGPRSPLPT